MGPRPWWRLVGLFGTSVLLLQCVDADPPTAPEGADPVLVILNPVVPPVRAPALETVNRLRVTALRSDTDFVLGRTVMDVDPALSEWQVSLDLEIESSAAVAIRLEMELIHMEGGAETVLWSGRTGSFAVQPGQAVRAPDTPLFRGGLTNLSVTSVRIDRPVPDLTEGESHRLTAVVQGAGGSPTVFWRSLEPDLADVSPEGVLTATLPGRPRIVAEAGPRADTVPVEVGPRAAGLRVAPDRTVFEKLGDQVELSATVLDPRGATLPGVPLEWLSRDAAVAESLGGGVFRATGNGSTWAVASGSAGATVRDSAEIVVAQRATEVEVTPAALEFFALGETRSLEARFRDANGNEVQGLPRTWSSSDPAVAAVSSGGQVSSVGNGQATITVQAGSLTASVQAAVTQRAVAAVIAPDRVELTALVQSTALSGEFRDANGRGVPNVPATWTSSHPGVAPVDGSGVVTAASNGTATITLSGSGLTATALVSVAQQPQRVLVTPASASLGALGQTLDLQAAVEDANGFPVEDPFIFWMSEDPSVVSVSEEGVATAVGPGLTRVHALSGGVSGTATLTVLTALSTGHVFVSNSDDDEITFLDLGGATASSHGCPGPPPYCREPRNPAVNPTGTLVAVPFRHSDEVGLFDPSVPDFVQILTDPSFDEPYAVAFTGDGSELWIANKQGGGSTTGSVSILNVATRAVVAVMNDIEFVSPEGIAIQGGLAFVANRQGGSLTVVNVAGRSVVRDVVVGGRPRDVAVTPDGQWAYVTGDVGYVTKVRVADGATTQIFFPLGGRSRNLAMAPDGQKVFVALQNADIAVVDVVGDAVRVISFAGAYETYGVAILRDGSRGFVTDVSGAQVFQFDPAAEAEITTGGFPWAVEYGSRGIVAH